MAVHTRASSFEQFAGIATYNLACAHSLKSEADEAFAHLEKAITLGFGDANQIESDSDFDNIRKDKRYADLIRRLKDNR